MGVAPESGESFTATGDKMKTANRTPIAITLLLLFGLVFLGIVRAQDEVKPSDPEAYYKGKCVTCHGQKAEKKFDESLTDVEFLVALLKGKKPE
jgi:hypothetical protein